MSHSQLIQMHKNAIARGRAQSDLNGMLRYFYIASRIMRAAISKTYEDCNI